MNNKSHSVRVKAILAITLQFGAGECPSGDMGIRLLRHSSCGLHCVAPPAVAGDDGSAGNSDAVDSMVAVLLDRCSGVFAAYPAARTERHCGPFA